MVIFLCSVCVAFLVGLTVGWTWKPKWVDSKRDKLASCISKLLDSFSSLKGFAFAPCLNSPLARSPNCQTWLLENSMEKKQPFVQPNEYEDCSTSQLKEECSEVAHVVTEEDLKHLYQLVEVKDGGPTWMQMMDRSNPSIVYQAWRREPKSGPPQYRSRTVFEDASPEILRDFFWDDKFRPRWDDMLAYSATIDQCPVTGTMVVQWIRKFPFFCSDREYIIGRRIWDSERSYYCITKGVPWPSIPRRNKPKRVDMYYSSWFIRAVESRRGDGRLTACEVLFFHHEDMGIPWEIAKLGVRHGMWGAVKKLEPGLRAYQKARASGALLSRPGFMAQVTTKISPELLRVLRDVEDFPETEVAAAPNKPLGRNIPKFLIIGGAIILACTIDQGFLPKAFIFGIARRFANPGKRLQV